MNAAVPPPSASSLDKRNHDWLRALGPWFERYVVPYHKAEVTGLDRIPSGAALYVGNHSGATLSIDSFIFGWAIMQRRGIEHLPFGLAHDLAMDLPGFRHILEPLGGVRAHPDNAARLFDAGHKLLVYPGGDEDAMRPYRARDEVRFGGRRGFARLAIRHGVPIIPVAAQGAHETLIIVDDLRWLSRLTGVDRRFRVKALPLALSLPWGLTLGPTLPYFPLPARIRVEVLEPIVFDRVGPEAAADDAYVTRQAERIRRYLEMGVRRLRTWGTPERDDTVGYGVS